MSKYLLVQCVKAIISQVEHPRKFRKGHHFTMTTLMSYLHIMILKRRNITITIKYPYISSLKLQWIINASWTVQEKDLNNKVKIQTADPKNTPPYPHNMHQKPFLSQPDLLKSFRWHHQGYFLQRLLECLFIDWFVNYK